MARYSETVMEHFTSPRNRGRCDDPGKVGVVGTPGQGAYLVLYLKVLQATVDLAMFQCHGCGATIAAGSMLTEMVIGRTIEQCRGLTEEMLLEALQGLPADKRHCAGFAVRALQQALDDSKPPEVP